MTRLVVRAGNGRQRREEIVTRLGLGVGDEEGVVARVGNAPAARREWSRALGRRRRRGGSGRARWERGAGDEENWSLALGRGAGDEEELGLESAKTRQCRRNNALYWVFRYQVRCFGPVMPLK